MALSDLQAKEILINNPYEELDCMLDYRDLYWLASSHDIKYKSYSTHSSFLKTDKQPMLITTNAIYFHIYVYFNLPKRNDVETAWSPTLKAYFSDENTFLVLPRSSQMLIPDSCLCALQQGTTHSQ